VPSGEARNKHKGKCESEDEGIGFYCPGISHSMSVLSVLSTGLEFRT
jgi:hypothetical protein